MFQQPISSLVVLPDDLKAYNPQAVDIHLTGIIPMDGDINWDSHSKDKIQRTMLKHDSHVKQSSDADEHFLQLTVNFVLEDNIWTNKVSTVQFYKEIQKKQEVFPVHKILLRDDVGMKDPEEKALCKIKEIAKSCGKSHFINSCRLVF